MEKSFAEALKSVRTAKRVSLRKLGEYVGLSIGYISDIEHGRRRPPDLETVRKMEEVLSVAEGKLVNLALQVRKKVPEGVSEVFYRNPRLAEALLRASDEEIAKIIEKLEEESA